MTVNNSAPCRSWVQQQLTKGNDGLQYVMRQTRMMKLILKHPEVPWLAKLVAACSVAYIFSPIQLIPSFIPVIGQLDDLAVLVIGMKLLRRLTPPFVLAECESKAASPITFQVQAKTSDVHTQELTSAKYHRAGTIL
jgi:uncharacterized membrane protein YkvA (DUF1232 family)